MALIAVFSITLDSEKGVSVTGPLGEKILFYGMCHEAMRAVENYKAPLVQPAVIVPNSPEPKQGLNGSGLRLVPLVLPALDPRS